MERVKKQSFGFIIVCLMLAVTASFIAAAGANTLAQAGGLGMHDKIFSDATIDDNFSDSSIIVVMDPNYSGQKSISMKQSLSLYSNINAKYIEDLTPPAAESKSGSGEIFHIELAAKSKQNVLNTIKKLENMPGILYAGPNEILSAATTAPNDHLLNQQWGLIGENGIDAESAWSITSGSKDVRVGVIDTGIAYNSDLNFLGDSNVTDGYDFHNETTRTYDDYIGHGTHVAGIIGAVGNNRKGITGVAQKVSLVPLQASFSSIYFEVSTLIKAINYATRLWNTENRISILNMSVSGFGETPGVLMAIERFPGLMVWAAGNENENVDNLTNISGYDIPNLISVGATNADGNRAVDAEWASNYGEYVNIFAPGQDIVSTFPHGPDESPYAVHSGTSMAAPHVAGVAALMLSANPMLTAERIKEIILDCADYFEIDTPDGTYLINKLNAGRAVGAVKLYNTQDLSSSDLEITGVNSSLSGKIIVPSKINDRKVVSIAASALANQTSCNELTLPDSINYIGSYAFRSWTSSQTIYFKGITGPLPGWSSLWDYGCSAVIIWEDEINPEPLITVAVDEDLTEFDIFNMKQSTRASSSYMMMLYDTLVTLDDNGILANGIADNIHTINSQVYQFDLRENAKFSNGEPVTAWDVAWLIGEVQNYPDSAIYGIWEQVDYINVWEDDRFRLYLKNPNIDFLYELAKPIAGIPYQNDYMIGSGAYRVYDTVAGDSIMLDRNECWWAEPAPTDTIVLTYVADSYARAMMFQSGECDVALGIDSLDLPELNEYEQGFSVYSVAKTMQMLMFNMEHWITQDHYVRMAISYCINIEEIAQMLCYELDCGEIHYRGQNFWDQIRTSYDIDYARALLDQSNYSEGLVLDLICGQENLLLAEIIQYRLLDIGIVVEIFVTDEVLSLETTQDYALVLYSYDTSLFATDVIELLYRLGRLNFSRYASGELDELFEVILHEQNAHKREDYYDELIRFFVLQDYPFINLGWRSYNTVYHTTVKDIKFSTHGIVDLRGIYIDQYD